MRFIVLSTRPKSRQRKLQEGQAIVLIALLLLVLFAMLGLAIDSGRAYVDKRDLQTAGGPTTATIVATATSIVGNQRQPPALLTLSSEACATHLQGSGSLTVLGDVYTNGTACIDSNLHLAGNCYGQTGSNCNAAAYYCYNASAGFIPYPPYTNGGNPCNGGDILGGPNVPAPTLPDPFYQTPSYPFYSGPGIATNRGSYIELSPGTYNNFSISSSVCFFLDPGISTRNGGYAAHGRAGVT